MHMTPPELLAETGKLLYGEHWMSEMANDLGINRETVRQFTTGRMRFPAEHPLMDRLVDLIDLRMVALNDLRLQFMNVEQENVVTLTKPKGSPSR